MGRGWRWHSGLPCCGRGALLAERVELALPLPGLVYKILHPGRQVLHTARQLGIVHVSHGIHKFYFSYMKSHAATGRGLRDGPAVRAGEGVQLDRGWGHGDGGLVVRAAVACRWICSAMRCLHVRPRCCASGSGRGHPRQSGSACHDW